MHSFFQGAFALHFTQKFIRKLKGNVRAIKRRVKAAERKKSFTNTYSPFIKVVFYPFSGVSTPIFSSILSREIGNKCLLIHQFRHVPAERAL